MSNILHVEEFLNSKVRPIFDQIIINMILEKPEDPVIINYFIF
jgi:hypothetical protein